jgi:hypothetical protein
MNANAGLYGRDSTSALKATSSFASQMPIELASALLAATASAIPTIRCFWGWPWQRPRRCW